MVPNGVINDKDLHPISFKIYCFMLSKPEGWSFYHQNLCQEINIERRTLSKYMKPLIAKKYVFRRDRREKGRFTGYDYTVVQSVYTDRSTYYADRRGMHSANHVPHSNTVSISNTINTLSNKEHIYRDFENFLNDEIWLEQNIYMRFPNLPLNQKKIACEKWRLKIIERGDEDLTIKSLRASLTKWMMTYEENYKPGQGAEDAFPTSWLQK